MSKLIFNMRPGPVILIKSGLKLKPGGSAEVKSVTEEMRLAEKRGLIRIGEKTATPPEAVEHQGWWTTQRLVNPT